MTIGIGARAKRFLARNRRALAITAVLVGFAWWAMPPRHSNCGPAPHRAICNNNLKQIGLALHTYRERHGTFPPAFVMGQDGQPAHSWRVLILPFLEQQALYDQYQFSEPWNGLNNSQLAALMPSAYRCPSFAVTGSDDHHTNYMAVVTPSSVFSGATPVSMNAITDSHSSTLLITESDAHTVHWMSPRDLQIDDAVGDIQAAPHTTGRNILLVDGAVKFLAQQTPRDEFTGMVTCCDEEPAVDLGTHP